MKDVGRLLLAPILAAVVTVWRSVTKTGRRLWQRLNECREQIQRDYHLNLAAALFRTFADAHIPHRLFVPSKFPVQVWWARAAQNGDRVNYLSRLILYEHSGAPRIITVLFQLPHNTMTMFPCVLMARKMCTVLIVKRVVGGADH